MSLLADHPDLISKLRISIDSLHWHPVPTGNRTMWRIGLPRKLTLQEKILIVQHLGLPKGRFGYRTNEENDAPELHIYSEPSNGQETLKGEA